MKGIWEAEKAKKEEPADKFFRQVCKFEEINPHLLSVGWDGMEETELQRNIHKVDKMITYLDFYMKAFKNASNRLIILSAAREAGKDNTWIEHDYKNGMESWERK